MRKFYSYNMLDAFTPHLSSALPWRAFQKWCVYIKRSDVLSFVKKYYVYQSKVDKRDGKEVPHPLHMLFYKYKIIMVKKMKLDPELCVVQ